MDIFEGNLTGFTSPLTNSEVSVHDTADHEFANITREILVSADGTLTVRLKGDSLDLALTGVSAGTRLPWRVTHVRMGSTAGVVGFW